MSFKTFSQQTEKNFDSRL